MDPRFAGKRGLVLGVANRRSIAWAIAKQLAEGGASLAFTYQGERIEKGVRELSDVALDPLALERERELRAAGGEPRRDRPRDRAPVGDAEDETSLSL